MIWAIVKGLTAMVLLLQLVVGIQEYNKGIERGRYNVCSEYREMVKTGQVSAQMLRRGPCRYILPETADDQIQSP